MLNIPLFVSKKEFFVTLGVAFFIACIALCVDYYHFRVLSKTPLHVSKATVLNHYQKVNAKGRTYDVFKLKLDGSGVVVYTTSWRALFLPIKSRVKVKLKVDKVTYVEYLKGFFAPSLALYEIYEDDPPLDVKPLYRFVENQHDNETIAELYKTLFFATPLSKELRADVQKWGISHLVAISGYHLGVISFLLFFLFKPLYQVFQNRYFPYRNSTADITFMVLVVLFGYMALIDFVPSFLRAFAMSALGFFFYSRGIKVLSFEMLGLTILGLLAFFPTLFFSLSFWFSVMGVFYIFLLLHHFSHLHKWALLGIIDIGVFLLMVPIVHTFFPVFTFLQLTSPLLSLVFIVFYPLGAVLHAINMGGVLDAYLLAFLHVKTESYLLSFPVWFLSCYIGLSLLAIRFRSVLFVCVGISTISLFFIQ